MKKKRTTNTRKTRAKASASKPYWEMNTAELREATKQFDQEFVGDTFRSATPQEQARFQRPTNAAAPVMAWDRKRSALRWKPVYWPKPTD